MPQNSKHVPELVEARVRSPGLLPPENRQQAKQFTVKLILSGLKFQKKCLSAVGANQMSRGSRVLIYKSKVNALIVNLVPAVTLIRRKGI